jgi:hypothetical protein
MKCSFVSEVQTHQFLSVMQHMVPFIEKGKTVLHQLWKPEKKVSLTKVRRKHSLLVFYSIAQHQIIAAQ